MADEVDVANDQLNSELSRVINKIRQNAGNGIGAKTCNDCGEDIPNARRELGFRYCIACAESRERRLSQFADD